MARNNLLNKDYNNFYENHFYIEENPKNLMEKREKIVKFEKEVNKLLNNKKTNQKIDYLQYIRGIADFEEHAFSEQSKYYKICNGESPKIDNYLFSEKSKLLKKMAVKIIKTERQKLSQKKCK